MEIITTKQLADQAKVGIREKDYIFQQINQV